MSYWRGRDRPLGVQQETGRTMWRWQWWWSDDEGIHNDGGGGDNNDNSDDEGDGQ